MQSKFMFAQPLNALIIPMENSAVPRGIYTSDVVCSVVYSCYLNWVQLLPS